MYMYVCIYVLSYVLFDDMSTICVIPTRQEAPGELGEVEGPALLDGELALARGEVHAAPHL